MCACICVYLCSDFCNPCFSSVSSSSGATRINSPHFFPSILLSLSLSPSLSLYLPEARCLGQLCIYSSVCFFVPFIYIYLSHAHTHPLVFCCQQWRLVSQSERERTFSKRLSGIRKEDPIAERVSVKDLLHYTCLLISLNHPFKIKVLISRIYFPK